MFPIVPTIRVLFFFKYEQLLIDVSSFSHKNPDKLSSLHPFGVSLNNNVPLKMDSRITSQKMRSLAAFTLFIAFLIIGVIFSNKAIQQYQERSTSFTSTTVPITLGDIPVLSFCTQETEKADQSNDISMKYYTNVKTYTEHERNFEFNSSVKSYGDMIQLSPLNSDKYSRCMSVFHGENYYENVPSEEFITEASIHAEVKVPSEIEGIMLYLTYQANSYGIPRNKFYDGQVVQVHLLSGRKEYIKIEVQEIEFLQSTCHHTTFYESLGKIVAAKNLSSLNITYTDKDDEVKACHMDGFCLTNDLPIQFPMCDDNVDHTIQNECYDIALQILQMEVAKNAGPRSKSCRVKDYFLVDKETILMSDDENKYPFEFEVSLNVPKSSTTWSHDLVKTVQKEYLVMDEINVIGTAGGIVALFIGLSFFDVCLHIWDLADKIFKLSKK